ncbi:MAG: T9SS type A sorting domain-containing protein [Bacteroidales bacterium]|nr:T9SS type A sorting domain-containing protein [Bacteroidales bacterium]
MKRLFTLFVLFNFTVFLSMAQLPESFGDLINSVDLGSQTPTPDRSITGIQYANGNLWVTGFDPDDYWQHKLYKFSGDGTELLETFSYGVEAAGWHDMAWDGEFLYVADMQVVRQIDPANGQKTGVTIPAPFYYNRGLAYNPFSDHFYIVGEGGFNIYEIDRDGNIVGAIANPVGHYAVGLAVDTISPGGPFLWAYSNIEEGYNLVLVAKQYSLQTNQFTGIQFNGASISNIIAERAGGATIRYNENSETLELITINIRNGSSQDQYEYAMFYDITRDEIPGPQILVNPGSIQNTVQTGDSIDVNVDIMNDGDATLFWSAYIETPDQDTINNLGDLLSSVNLTQQSGNDDRGIKGITYLDNKIWINGRNYSQNQPTIYEFDNAGNLLASHPYFSLNGIGFFSITSDGEYLYGEDTYTIMQIDPVNFQVVDNIIKPSGSFSDMTYDPQTDHFWGGNSNGLIYEFDRDGEVVNEFVTNLAIKGLAWDQWSPGGPFLWAWIEVMDGDEVIGIDAVRLNPHTCTPAGNGFAGVAFSNDTLFTDTPNGIVITSALENNNVSLLGLHNAGQVNGSDTISGTDFMAVYDLDVVPPPGWIKLLDTSYGEITAGQSEQFTVRLLSLMEDTVMTANIRISNNDIENSEWVIPVSFEMTNDFISATTDLDGSRSEALGQNYPNPFVQSTVIPVYLKKSMYVNLSVFDQYGRLVDRTFSGYLPEGAHHLQAQLPDLPDGIYYYTLQSEKEQFTKRMVIKK